MARSYKKNVGGTCCSVRRGTMKSWKRQSNRRLRRRVNMGEWDLTLQDVSNIWDSPADGKGLYPPTAYRYDRLARK